MLIRFEFGLLHIRPPKRGWQPSLSRGNHALPRLSRRGAARRTAVASHMEHNPFQIPALLKTAFEYGKSLAELCGAAVHVGATFCWQ